MVVLSSSVVSALISAGIGGWISLRTKKDEYTNTYYKMILERRIGAYEEVEALISTIKTAVVDSDRRPYHILFSNVNGHAELWATLQKGMGQALWLSDDLFEATRELNMLVYADTSEAEGLIEFGKRRYEEIGKLRTKLEKLHARDMIELHDIKRFLRSKKSQDAYAVLPLRS